MGGGGINFLPWWNQNTNSLSRGSDLVRSALDPLSLGGNPQTQRANQKLIDDAAGVQNNLIKAAEDKAQSEKSTNASAISRARMKALAAATAATGRSSTIKTGQQGVIGSAPGTEKTLIGQ